MIVVQYDIHFQMILPISFNYMAENVVDKQGTPEEVFDAPKSEKTRAFLRKSLEEIF